MKNLRFAVLLTIISSGFLLASCRPDIAQTPGGSAETMSRRYEIDDSLFMNPERGFHKNTDLLTAKDLHWVREQGYSLVRAYVRMDAFRDRPLTPEYLDSLRRGFAVVRAAGIKVLPIFAYNFPTDEDIKADRVKNSPDAPLPLVLEHLRQLKPIWHENQDVIACLELGFVGAWGEWHSSGNHLDTPENKKAVLNAILDALPKSRMMQIRYPGDIMAIFPVPLNEKQAFSGSHQARTAFANMCFLSNESDSGTYQPLNTKEAKQKYLAQMTTYVVVGGETCQITPEQSRADCSTALSEFQRFHFSYINMDFYQPTVARWKQDGCIDTIFRRLGYRFALQQASVPRRSRPGETVHIHFSLRNEGWASPYNPRKVELILRSKTDRRTLRFPVKADPRRWFASDKRYDIDAAAKIPDRLPAGDYEILINLPDPQPSLRNRPEYSIRFANKETWEPATGFNRLLLDCHISR